MAGTTFQQLAEKISTTFYEGIPNDEVKFSLVHIAQLAAEEIAAMAIQDAYGNSKLQEATFSNDQFITTYTGLDVLIDPVQNLKYVPLPASPASLPIGREIQAISPVNPAGQSSRKVQIVMMRNKDRFMQNYLDPIPGVVLGFVQNNGVYFDNSTPFNFSAVNMNLIGAMPSGDLMAAIINCPKSYEGIISQNVINRLLKLQGKPRETIENIQAAQN